MAQPHEWFGSGKTINDQEQDGWLGLDILKVNEKDLRLRGNCFGHMDGILGTMSYHLTDPSQDFVP